MAFSRLSISPLGEPFLSLDEDGRGILFSRNESRINFKLTEIASNTPTSNPIKTYISGLLKHLYDAWTGMLPNQGAASFYGCVRGKCETIKCAKPSDTFHYIHIGLGFTTYPITGIHLGDPNFMKQFCEVNQLPTELIL